MYYLCFLAVMGAAVLAINKYCITLYVRYIFLRSYGVLLWELMTHEIPYRDVDSSAIIWGVGSNSLHLPLPVSCPEGFKLLMRQCWWVEIVACVERKHSKVSYITGVYVFWGHLNIMTTIIHPVLFWQPFIHHLVMLVCVERPFEMILFDC